MKNKLEKESRSAALGTVIIVVIMVIVFGAVFAWMYRMDLLFLPGFVERLLGMSGNSEDPEWDLGALSEIVKEGKDDDGEKLTFDVTYENLRAAFLNEKEPEGIYICADVSYFDVDAPSVKRVRFYRNGDKFRSETYALGDNEQLETLMIADSTSVTVTDRPTGEVHTLARSADICAENEAGIPSVDNLFYVIQSFPPKLTDGTLDDEAVLQSGISDYDIKLVRYRDSSVYYAAFTYEDLGVREEYYVSLDYRIIIACYTSKNGVPLYSYETVRVSTHSDVWSEDALYTVENP